MMDYREWLNSKWRSAGGLLSQASAAKYLGRTRTRIRQMIKEGKLKSYQYQKDAPMVSFAEIAELAEYYKNEIEVNGILHDNRKPENMSSKEWDRIIEIERKAKKNGIYQGETP